MQTVLFVEDDKVINDKISIGLKNALGDQVQILSVYTIQGARQTMQEINVDLLILDIEFQDGNGIDFAREIRNNHRFMPIMIASSYTTEKLHAQLNNEIDLFLCLKKPYEIDDIVPKLINTLERILENNTSFVTLKEGKKRFKFAVSDIIKVETVKGMKRIEVMFFSANTRDVLVRQFPVQSMENFMNLLPKPKGLVRISQSVAVNPNFVIGFDNETNELYLKHTDKILSIGKTYRETLGVLFSRLK